MPGYSVEPTERQSRERSRTLNADYSKQKEVESTSNFCQGFVSFLSFGVAEVRENDEGDQRRARRGIAVAQRGKQTASARSLGQTDVADLRIGHYKIMAD
jgi:hypothetical protein